jgi:phage terminase large subunit-like protein
MTRRVPHAYAGQFQQRPAPRGGGLFKRSDFRIVEAAPEDVQARVRYWDKAGTEGGGAYSAGVLMSRGDDGMFYVEDVVRGQWSSHQRNVVMEQTAALDGPLTTIWVEQEPGSGGKESAEFTLRLLAGYDVHAERPTGDKVTRARPFAPEDAAREVPWTSAEEPGGWTAVERRFRDGHTETWWAADKGRDQGGAGDVDGDLPHGGEPGWPGREATHTDGGEHRFAAVREVPAEQRPQRHLVLRLDEQMGGQDRQQHHPPPPWGDDQERGEQDRVGWPDDGQRRSREAEQEADLRAGIIGRRHRQRDRRYTSRDIHLPGAAHARERLLAEAGNPLLHAVLRASWLAR